MIVSCIAAVAENGVIGRDGALPWRLPADLKHFRRTTWGHTVVMGRKTWESVGRPLPGRRSIVITGRRGYEVPEGVRIARSLDEALMMSAGEGEVFVVGGSSLYREALPRADRLYLTRVKAAPDGDVHFPPFAPEEWDLVEREVRPADESNPHDLEFLLYAKRRNGGAAGPLGPGRPPPPSESPPASPR
jgi:dihydrofolate reductase